jgi:hypothetical protein
MNEVLRSEPHVEGVVEVDRAKAIVLADGLWPDGERYRVLLTLR